MYNSAGRFSTPLKTFSSRRVFRPSIEQGASPPVLWSRGASPPDSRGCLFSPVALASAVIAVTDLNALECIASTPRVHLKYAFNDVHHVLEVYLSIYLLMNTNLKDKYILESK